MRFDAAMAALRVEDPFRFVGRVLDASEHQIWSEMHYPTDHPVITGHRRVANMVPGVVLMEQAAQTAWLLSHLRGEGDAKDNLVIGALQGKFIRPVTAPATINCALRVVYSHDGKVGFMAELTLAGEVVALVKGACHRLAGRQDG